MKKIYTGILVWSMCFANVGIVTAAELNIENESNNEISRSELEETEISSEEIEDTVEDTSESTTEIENDQTEESETQTSDSDQTEEFTEETQNNSISESQNESKEEIDEESIVDNVLEYSDVNVIASGQNGTGFTWTLYEDGLLTFGGGTWLGGFPPWYSKRSEVLTVVITDKVETSLNNSDGFGKMFTDCANLTSITGLELLNTGNSKSFGRMFANCESLERVDVSSFDTSNSTSFQDMFYNCKNLEGIDISNFDTSNATNFSGMFGLCNKVTTLDVAKFNTEKAINLDRMFAGCYSVLNLDVSNFNTKNCTNFSQMFSNVRVDRLDITNFNTEKATNMNFMFQRVSNITELNLSHFETKNVTSMEYMFQGMSNLINLDLQGWDVSNVQNINGCFADLTSIEQLDLSHFVTSSVREADYVFRNMKNLKELNIENWIIPSGLLAYNFLKDTLPEKMTIGSGVVLNTHMYIPDLNQSYVWVDKKDEVIYSNQLIDYHNTNEISNTYRLEELHTLTFNTSGGSEISSQRSISGKTWSIPEVPEKNGFIFDYWSTDSDGKNRYDFSTLVSGSLMLYAQYTPAYVVTIPASVNLNETNQLQVSAENFQEDKSLSISTSNKVTLINTQDTNLTIDKELTLEKKYTEQDQVLEVIGKEKKENTLYILPTEGTEPAGKYKGTLNFSVEFY